jgi:hypothetical protein
VHHVDKVHHARGEIVASQRRLKGEKKDLQNKQEKKGGKKTKKKKITEEAYQYLTTSSSNCQTVFSAIFLNIYDRPKCNKMAPTVTPRIINAAVTEF